MSLPSSSLYNLLTCYMHQTINLHHVFRAKAPTYFEVVAFVFLIEMKYANENWLFTADIQKWHIFILKATYDFFQLRAIVILTLNGVILIWIIFP